MGLGECEGRRVCRVGGGCSGGLLDGYVGGLGAGGWRVGGCVRGGWGLGELEEVSAGWEVHALAGELERRWVSGYAVV